MESSRIKIDSVHLSNILSEKELEQITMKKFSKGNLVYDNQSLTLYVFKSGKAKAVIYENDEEFILYYLEKDNIIIPEESCSIEFLEDSEVYVINEDLFADFFKNKLFASAVISSLKKRAVMERRIIKNLVFKTCKNRLASFLLEVAIAQNEELQNNIYITLNLSIKELATFIGAKRQTVSTMFHELMKNNIIQKNEKNKYIINNIDKLKEYTYSS